MAQRSPAESWKARVVSVFGDPLMTGLNAGRSMKRIRDEVAFGLAIELSTKGDFAHLWQRSQKNLNHVR